MTSKIEDWIIAHVGTRTSFVLHIFWFAYWITRPVELFPFGLLTMVVSLEAILLSILIMLSQRRHDAILEVQSKNDKRIETEKLDKILAAFEELFTHLPQEFIDLRRAMQMDTHAIKAALRSVSIAAKKKK